METLIKKLTESELLEKYPIKSNIAGWYFCADEVSNNVYKIEGSDLLGRKISAQGCDYKKSLKDAEFKARQINNAK